MKKIFLLLSFFSLLIVNSCKKEDKKEETPPTLEVRIDGLSDFTLGYDSEKRDFEKKSMPLAISQLTGSQENISISTEDVPNGITISFSTTSGTPNFSTTMEATLSEGIKMGTYPIKIVLKNNAGAKKTYTFKITVSLPCNVAYSGKYIMAETINGVVRDTVTNYLVIQFSSKGNVVYNSKSYEDLEIDCAAKSIIIPKHEYRGNDGTYGIISGNGVIKNDTITVNCILKPYDLSPDQIIKKVYTR